ncbi:hypothetical protein CC2G_014272 [Coprinopsis cinerea AmutBmut pab1-1]|nr:hypothetical protein CC2G_014272 [Coprinopsis cinerea AmutBmut pab1-1]
MDRVMNYGNPASLSEPRLWTFPLSAIITTCTAFTAQLFLIYRAYRLTRENILLVIPLFLVSLTATILGLVHGTRVWMLSSLDQIPTIMDTLTPWLSMEVAADWLIAGTLLWAIRDSRTLYRRSGEVVWQLFRTAVQTGLIASLFASATMILRLVYPKSDYPLLTGVPIGFVYAGTIMDTLLCRQALRDMLSDAPLRSSNFKIADSTQTTNSTEETGPSYPSRTVDKSCGVQTESDSIPV